MGRCVVWDPFRNSHPDDVEDHVYVGGVLNPNNADIQTKAGQLVNYDDDVFAGDSREQLRGSTKSSTGHFSPGSVGGAQISPRPPDMSQFFTRYSQSTSHPQV